MRALCMISCASVVAAAFKAPSPVTFKTFKSLPVALRSGQIANTRNTDYPLDFPAGPIAVRYFASRVIDEQGNNVSMSEVYVHHWLIYDGGHNGGLCPNLPNVWGIGAELVNVVYDYPYPMAYVTSGKEEWTANLHFIRTSNVPSAGVQDCIECRCKDSNPPLKPHGEVGCCEDQTQCWGMENSTLQDTKNYYLEYTVGYDAVTPDIQPSTIISLDVTATSSSDCQIQYDVPALDANENHTMTSDSVLPSDWNVSWVGTHLHVGGLEMMIDHYRAGAKVGQLCTGVPVYQESGEGKGHLIDIPPCIYPTPYQLLKGDVLRLTSIYGSRTLPGGNPWHAGVMGLAFLAVTAKPDAHTDCMTALHYWCGSPIYPSGQNCHLCAEYPTVTAALTVAGCTKQWVVDECAKNNDNGNIPAPDGLVGMNLTVVADTTKQNTYNFHLTCPAKAWCGVGYTFGDPVMANTTAFTYTENADSSGMGFDQRVLGNHNPGTITKPDYPATVTSVDSSVDVTFSVEIVFDEGNFERICFLFAQGASGVTTFGYHGASRGFSCLTIQQFQGEHPVNHVVNRPLDGNYKWKY